MPPGSDSMPAAKRRPASLQLGSAASYTSVASSENSATTSAAATLGDSSAISTAFSPAGVGSTHGVIAFAPPSPSPSPVFPSLFAPVHPVQASPASVAREINRPQAPILSEYSLMSSKQLLQRPPVSALSSLDQTHSSNMITPPDEYPAVLAPAPTLSSTLAATSSDPHPLSPTISGFSTILSSTKSCSTPTPLTPITPASSTSAGTLIDNIIDDNDDEISVAAAASLLSRPETDASPIHFDPDAFSDDRPLDFQSRNGSVDFSHAAHGHDGTSPEHSYSPGLLSPSSSSVASNTASSSPVVISKAILKKIVPAKLRQGLKRRMSAPYALPIASSSPFVMTSSGKTVSALTPTERTTTSLTATNSATTTPTTMAGGYFDLAIASKTNLETGEYVSEDGPLSPLSPGPPASNSLYQIDTSSPGLGSRSSPIKSSSGQMSPALTSGVTSPTAQSVGTPSPNIPSGSHLRTQSISSVIHSTAINNSVLSASVAMNAVILSNSPTLEPSPLLGGGPLEPPELYNIETPLSPTPIQPPVAESSTKRTSSTDSHSKPMTTTASSAAGSHLSQSSQDIQQLQQRLQDQVNIQNSGGILPTAILPDNLAYPSGAGRTIPSAVSPRSNSSHNHSFSDASHADASEYQLAEDQELSALMNSMRVEDQAFAVTEDRLKESGWTSDAELKAIRNNRVAARQKWEAAIAVHQVAAARERASSQTE
ncbi:uncharacterized protein V1516DRAFT_675677 [Lipomyces oligophaga]|uniref:uncharacterized protein n=1 Tax=Lipomyces oligophaga TaxID=45792 RepID=UPI0034CE0E23